MEFNMADKLNIDEITSDEDIDNILNQIDSGSFDFSINSANDDGEENEGDESGNSDNDENLDTNSNSEDNEDDEDTNHSEDDSDDSASGDEGDGSDDDSDDEDENEDEDNARKDDNADDKKDNDSDTDETSDGEAQDKANINVVDYEKYKKFYEDVTKAEFIANGKKVKGFDDPTKIIQAQQMSYGFSDKMAGIKKYKPFLIPLKEAGILDDPDKFNLAMNLISGDKEAIKAHIKKLELDPVIDLDIDNINYTATNHLATKEKIALDETFEQARDLGIESKFREVIADSAWDDESFSEILSKPSTRNDLMDHISSGAYELVKDKIAEIKRTDVNGSYSSMKMTDQYRVAVRELQAEAAAYEAEMAKTQGSPTNADTIAVEQAKVEAAKAKILEDRKAAEYKAKAEEENRKISENRRRATSVSKAKPKVKPTKQFDPLALDGDDLDALVDSMISGKFLK